MQMISTVLRRRLETEGQRWLSALETGFNITIVSQEPLLLAVVQQFLEEKFDSLRVSSAQGRSTDAGTGDVQDTEDRFKTPVILEHPKKRLVLLALTSAPRGFAAVTFPLPPLASLLPSAAAMVTQILEATRLDKYIEAFDGKILAQLRKILESSGPDVFLDAVIQTAYLAGFRGDEKTAGDNLEKLVQSKSRPFQGYLQTPSTPASMTRHGASWDNLQENSVTTLFEQLLQQPDPHDVFKAALAHYVIYGRNVTQTEASRILKVSRSTLQAHLRLAEQLNVTNFFQVTQHHA
jgi:hypothetical protein